MQQIRPHLQQGAGPCPVALERQHITLAGQRAYVQVMHAQLQHHLDFGLHTMQAHPFGRQKDVRTAVWRPSATAHPEGQKVGGRQSPLFFHILVSEQGLHRNRNFFFPHRQLLAISHKFGGHCTAIPSLGLIMCLRVEWSSIESEAAPKRTIKRANPANHRESSNGDGDDDDDEKASACKRLFVPAGARLRTLRSRAGIVH